MERSRSPPHLEDELAKMLRSAIDNDDEKEVENLIKRGGVDVNSRDSSGETPLHRACWKRGNEKIVRLLLNAGANPNALDDRGRTPLMDASEYRYPKVVKILLDAGADVNVKDEDGATALTLVVKLFGEKSATKIVTMLIKAGVEIKSKDVYYASIVSDEIYRIVKNAYLRQQLTPLLSASARGQVFDSRLYDRRLWRIVSRFVN